MPYASQQDLIDRVGEDELLVAADRDRDGVIDAAVVDGALEDASAEIDSYLAQVYALPLPSVPRLINRLACDIAFHRLSPEADTSTEYRRSRYDEAVSLLKKLAGREITLGMPQAPTTRTKPSISSAPRRWRGRRLT
ncbi:DUF1320 domain-containing protein [Halomonas sp.]|uniref:gp436 family protein n=1 Tax=Halomonas sp. TaxID=1486246 RepID=UPI00257ED204|nr:DUF1320 domain-containing protein [Halomonas sp.]MCJ8285107.1 DUF1320 domain-containing protein [Halomonas sp.]NQY70157.1 DUF1320 domain-containing protein [Halomonas sp.]